MGIYLDRHTLMQERFVGNHAMQFCKGPFGLTGIGFALLLAGSFALKSLRTFADSSQVFQSNQAVGKCLYDPLAYYMVSILRSPVSLVHVSP
jgi:hypothetical protein